MQITDLLDSQQFDQFSSIFAMSSVATATAATVATTAAAAPTVNANNIGILCNGSDNNYNYNTSTQSQNQHQSQSSQTQTHHLVSTNSFELNAATSLSDDSGVPLTNSSISSGDSYRLGLCKLELEVNFCLLYFLTF